MEKQLSFQVEETANCKRDAARAVGEARLRWEESEQELKRVTDVSASHESTYLYFVLSSRDERLSFADGRSVAPEKHDAPEHVLSIAMRITIKKMFFPCFFLAGDKNCSKALRKLG